MDTNKMIKHIKKKARDAQKLIFFHDVPKGINVKCIDRRTHEVRRVVLPRDRKSFGSGSNVFNTLGL